MDNCILTSHVYAAAAASTLGMFAVYGLIGGIFYYKDLSKFPDRGDWPFNQRLTIYIIIGVNACYVAAGGVGLVALTNRRTHMFLWSSFLLLGTFAVQLLHGVACLRASTEPMNAVIFSSFRQFRSDASFQDWLGEFQWQYDCCGVKSYMDWILLNGTVSNISGSVPDSCCSRKERVPTPNCGQGLLAPNVSVEVAKKVVNTVGCGDQISNLYQRDIKAKAVVMLIAAFLAVSTGLLIFLCKQKVQQHAGHRQHRRQTLHPSNRPQGHVARKSLTSQRGSNHTSKTPSLKLNAENNGHTYRIPSYYKASVAHKPPTGRGRLPRQDSTRDFKTGAQRNTAKYRLYTYQRQKHGGANLSAYSRISPKSERGQNELMKTKLEMLMHPIETHSTSSATPNPSDMFPFHGDQPSSSASFLPIKDSERGGQSRSRNCDRKITHYNSLPQVVTFPDGRVETLYHYNTSHVHAHSMRRKHSTRTKPTFVEGKFPSLTITSTLATIHEENESVKSGNSQASSTCTTTTSSSPKSVSESPSKQRQQLDSEAVARELISADKILEGEQGEGRIILLPKSDHRNANEEHCLQPIKSVVVKVDHPP